ncbi:hypothetical protein [Lysobacter sp. Root667]|uniref:hypothetical protein n=1 Tax=Lysobacter sp. Root667 TaxID=1736581 RepID=UPI000AFE3976|nr:hypothetical protein [Lysobacter sp. Root667]
MERIFHLHARSCGFILLLLASGLTPGEAAAQMVVQDPAVILGQARQTFADAKEFGLQAKRWNDTYKSYTDTYKHYQQQLIRLQRLNFGDPQMEDAFPERALNYGMEDSCPAKGNTDGVPGGVLTRIFNAAQPKMDGAVLDEQQKVCERMVQAENARYNESVRMLKTLIQRNREFQAVQRQRDQGGQDQGALAANDNEVQRFVARIAMDLDYWQARMTAYQGYIESLKLDQTRLAKRAMRGKKGQGAAAIAGQVVQAAALKAALGY